MDIASEKLRDTMCIKSHSLGKPTKLLLKINGQQTNDIFFYISIEFKESLSYNLIPIQMALESITY